MRSWAGSAMSAAFTDGVPVTPGARLTLITAVPAPSLTVMTLPLAAAV